MDQMVFYWAGGVVTVGAAIGMLWRILKPIHTRLQEVLNKMDSFMRDWEGEPAAPGRSAVPGVMERLNRIDGELKRNGGSSMKDAINRVEQKLSKIDERLEEGNQRFLDAEGRITLLEIGEKNAR